MSSMPSPEPLGQQAPELVKAPRGDRSVAHWRNRGLRQITADLAVFTSLSVIGAVELAPSMFFSPNGMDEPRGAPLSTPIRLRRRLLFVPRVASERT